MTPRYLTPGLWLVAYDIVDDKRRRRVARALEGYGWRIQDSVFLCEWLNGQRLDAVKTLEKLIDPIEDTIRLYPVCGRDRRDLENFGRKLAASPMIAGYVIV